jgi:hypothetical protein
MAAKTPAQRMKEYRGRIKASQQPDNVQAMLIASYEQGYADALKRLAPNPPKNAIAALGYLCGGMDAI